ncbi:hypothetical protein Taro_034849 [Colocasia esculenta]|uniref:SET domain-containing protein n=1 Tax=Colocasia esculenta TaxID=4460 RepID=A0A843WGS2_COLES|nr:hypothetical protein [Colocasia esculenta]
MGGYSRNDRPRKQRYSSGASELSHTPYCSGAFSLHRVFVSSSCSSHSYFSLPCSAKREHGGDADAISAPCSRCAAGTWFRLMNPSVPRGFQGLSLGRSTSAPSSGREAMGSRPKDRAVKAMAAMKDIGFSTAKTKIVLKQLLKTFYNNWTHIESENYRLLVEALVESDVAEVEDRKGCKDSDDNLHSKKKEATPPDDPEPHRKKLREGKEGWPLTSVQNAGMSSKSTSLGQGSVAAVEEMSSDSALDTELPSNDPEANCQRTFRDANLSLPELKGSSTAQVANEDNTRRNCSAGGYGTGAKEKLANVVESPSDAVEIVSSTTGGARLLLSCNVVDCPSFQMPDLQSVIKKVEDKCLRSYKILDPKFSLMNIMKELCDTLLEMGTESVEGKLEEHLARINPLLDPLKLICSGNLASGVSTCHATSSSGLRLPQDPEPMAMDGVEHLAQPILLGEGDVRPVHDLHDITKGEERVRISVVNVVNTEEYPPHFSYIPHNIVFFTSERKGWGLRAVDDLPKGAFVCEYVGEILTNMELYHRTLESTGNARHTYPVLLDADWGSEGLLGDEEALCLDATFYGNVARFINHRCAQAPLACALAALAAPWGAFSPLRKARCFKAVEEAPWRLSGA